MSALNMTIQKSDAGFFATFPVLASFASWNNARKTRNALSKLSDRELDDIGLTRGDIERLG